jgi:hypothetical protein
MVSEPHRTAQVRVAGRQLATGYLGMLQNVPEVLDVNDDVVLFGQLDVVEFVHFHCDGCMQGLLQDGSYKQSIS